VGISEVLAVRAVRRDHSGDLVALDAGGHDECLRQDGERVADQRAGLAEMCNASATETIQ
jgi:hypothetical protein